MDIDFDKLAQKTFEITHNTEHLDTLNKEKKDSPYFEEMMSEIYEDISEDGLPMAPAGPGILFRIDKSSQSFCIRGFATTSIEQSLIDIESGEVKSCSCLKIKSEEDYDHVNFFEFESLELADRIKQSLFNRRFPVDEALVCNLSDPGFSWWLEDNVFGLEVFFQTYQAMGRKQFQKLGPLGDHFDAIDIFRDSENILRKYFPINEFSCDDKSLKIIPCDPENNQFKELLNLLYKGDQTFLSKVFPTNEQESELLRYLKELSCTRMFWLNVEEILEDY
ncbi:MAG: hypothetical protein HN576_01080 [Bacteriovoracaceae bacterium]|jgi:hypothetical protein|nr:hypothetical protein [Bacteriovoracaceae bacterium]